MTPSSSVTCRTPGTRLNCSDRGWPREPHFDAPDGTLLQARDGLDRDHPAVPHDRDAVRNMLDLVELVRREEHRTPGRCSLADKVEDILLT